MARHEYKSDKLPFCKNQCSFVIMFFRFHGFFLIIKERRNMLSHRVGRLDKYTILDIYCILYPFSFLRRERGFVCLTQKKPCKMSSFPSFEKELRHAVSIFEFSKGLLAFGSCFTSKEEKHVTSLPREELRDKNDITPLLASKIDKKRKG